MQIEWNLEIAMIVASQRRNFELKWTGTTLLVLTIVLALVRLTLAANLELHFDEAYYWHWSKHLQASYYDHPPMVAWLIHLGTGLFGDSELGVRFPGWLLGLATIVLTFDMARRAFGGRAAILAALFAQATLLLGVGSIIMTPDTPLLFFCTAATWALVCLAMADSAAERRNLWILIGFCGGAALLSKYTAAIIAAAVGVWLLTSPRMLPQLRTPWPWIAVLIAAACFAPVIWWNAAHDWVSFNKQGGRINWTGGLAPGRVFEFLGGQIGVVTPVLFALLVLAVGYRVRQGFAGEFGEEGRTAMALSVERLLVLLFTVPFGFFLLQSLFIRINPNWPAPIWPPAIVLTAGLLARARLPQRLERLTPWAIGVGLALTGLIWLHAALPQSICVPGDPTAHLRGQNQLTSDVIGLAIKRDITRIASPEYDTASWLRFYAPAGVEVEQVAPGRRYAGYANPDPRPQPPLLIVSRRAELSQQALTTYSTADPAVVLWRQNRGCKMKPYYLFVANGPAR